MHKGCGGRWIRYQVPERHYCFMRCGSCGAYLGGERTRKQAETLRRAKVLPSVRRLSLSCPDSRCQGL
jgi:hypothetical protein